MYILTVKCPNGHKLKKEVKTLKEKIFCDECAKNYKMKDLNKETMLIVVKNKY